MNGEVYIGQVTAFNVHNVNNTLIEFDKFSNYCFSCTEDREKHGKLEKAKVEKCLNLL